MNETSYADTSAVAIQVSRGVVVASVQIDLTEDVLARFRQDLLGRIHESGSRSVIFDLAGLATLDKTEFQALRQLMTMVEIMGAQSVLVGLRPGVVSALIEAGADTDGLLTAIDLDTAFDMLQPHPKSQSGTIDAEQESQSENPEEVDTESSTGQTSSFEPVQSARKEQ
jgi:rsbT antagonist protein RsbS